MNKGSLTSLVPVLTPLIHFSGPVLARTNSTMLKEVPKVNFLIVFLILVTKQSIIHEVRITLVIYLVLDYFHKCPL